MDYRGGIKFCKRFGYVLWNIKIIWYINVMFVMGVDKFVVLVSNCLYCCICWKVRYCLGFFFVRWVNDCFFFIDVK